jgi:hypothetical protein
MVDWSKTPEGGKADRSQREGLSRAAVSVASVTVMAEIKPDEIKPQIEFYCPRCHAAVSDPLVCGDCSALICRRCGTPLEQVDELGIG